MFCYSWSSFSHASFTSAISFTSAHLNTMHSVFRPSSLLLPSFLLSSLSFPFSLPLQPFHPPPILFSFLPSFFFLFIFFFSHIKGLELYVHLPQILTGAPSSHCTANPVVVLKPAIVCTNLPCFPLGGCHIWLKALPLQRRGWTSGANIPNFQS